MCKFLNTNPNRSQRGKGIFPLGEQEFNKQTRFETSAKSFLILQKPISKVTCQCSEFGKTQ